MENFDSELARRVWQRVSAGAEPTAMEKVPEPDHHDKLLFLIAEERADAAAYLALARRMQGNHATVLRRLGAEEMSHAACLAGLYRLQTGNLPAAQQMPQSPPAPAEAVLRRCYIREMRRISEYEALARDLQDGMVFARLAGQKRGHCQTLLEILGTLPR